ncbi:FHA domain protein [compost metagenome]
MSTLTLSITNLDQLQHNVAARHQFDRTGGTIGSAKATWQINDREQTVAPIHCEIRWIEGSFCVIDRCQRTYLNDSLHSLGSLTARRLLEGDQLRIGAYRLQAQLAQADARSLEDLFSPEQRTLDHWLLDVPPEACHAAAAAPQTVADICSAFEPGMGNDPLAALDTEAAPAQQSPLEHLIAGERP